DSLFHRPVCLCCNCFSIDRPGNRQRPFTGTGVATSNCTPHSKFNISSAYLACL
ncbi:MAG: hypothetical protein AVDCRST_MAG96-1441, partial [uncultured Segetibacter sp.]